MAEEAVANAHGLGAAVFCTAVCAALVVSVCISVSACVPRAVSHLLDSSRSCPGPARSPTGWPGARRTAVRPTVIFACGDSECAAAHRPSR